MSCPAEDHGATPPRALVPGATHLTPSVVPQRGHARHLREKQAVLGAFAEQALVAVPGFDARPALDALAALAMQEHPAAWATKGRSWHAPWLGWAIDGEARVIDHHGGWPELGPQLCALPPPWRHAALLSLAFAEDFVVLDAGSRRVQWLAVALPSFWAPERSIGQPYDRPLPAPGFESFIGIDCPSPRLHAHPQRVDTVPAAGRRWWRTERSTGIAVPNSAQRIVTLRVDTRLLP